MTRKRRRSANRPGQSLVEFALTLPLVLLILMGIIQFGRAWMAQQVLTDAGREAVRRAAVADPTVTIDTVQLVVKKALARASLDSSAVQIIMSGTAIGTAGVRGDAIGVQLALPFSLGWLTPFMQFSMGQGVTLRTFAEMRHE
jgi:Flp pilus assembly protein TadG